MTREEERRIRAIELATHYKATQPQGSWTDEEFMLIVKEFYDFIKYGTQYKEAQQ